MPQLTRLKIRKIAHWIGFETRENELWIILDLQKQLFLAALI